MSLLASVTTAAPQLPSRVVMYAPEKSGKTSWAAFAPNPIFLMTAGETGLLSLIESGQVPPTAHFPEDFKTWDELHEGVRSILTEKHEYRTLVLDTGNGAEQMLAQCVCSESYGGDWGAYNEYGRGVNLSAPRWGQFLGLLDQVRVKRRMSVIFLHHATVKQSANPTGKDWDQHRPEAIKQMWGLTHKWADVIAYYGVKVTVNKDDKATGEQRYLRCAPSAAIVAGNRYGLPEEITAAPGAKNLWDAFAKEMGKAKAKAAKQNAAPVSPPPPGTVPGVPGFPATPPSQKNPGGAKAEPDADTKAKLAELAAMAADGPELDGDGNPIFGTTSPEPDEDDGKLFGNPKKGTGVPH